jgi:uncharacterized alkaline shock family protein YloU
MSTEAAERGRTTVADTVVSKIAARATTEVDQAAGSSRRLFGVTVGRVAAASPARADAEVDGNIASVHVAMSVRWPAPVREVSRRVREHVSEQVSTMTGLRVAEVDIDVTSLVTATGQPTQRVV